MISRPDFVDVLYNAIGDSYDDAADDAKANHYCSRAIRT
jgi:hypothetical protein